MIYQLLEFINFIGEEHEQILNGCYGWVETTPQNAYGGENTYRVMVSKVSQSGWGTATTNIGNEISIHPRFNVELNKEYLVEGSDKFMVQNVFPL